MKNHSIVVGVALGALLLGAFLLRDYPVAGQDKGKAKEGKAAAKAAKEKRNIVTTGSARIRVQPDSARVYLQVETIGATVEKTRRENAAAVKKVLDVVKALNIPDLKMKTANVQTVVIQSRVEKEDKLPRILGYRVSNSFTVLIQNKDRVKLSQAAGQVLDSALENGANSVQQIEFFKQDMNDLRRDVLTRATEDAINNARALAKGAGKNIVDVILVSNAAESFYNPSYNVTSLQNAFQPGGFGGAEGTSTTVVAGDLEVTCRVNVTCVHD
jgi:uncharacterized protein YggE